ncbi:MAG TPA: DUF3977 family protein [Candidatus Doudnabacteria bacterium]|nr:DUF3977 family protein [Candidatus Doudnabacteria bacterium]
MKKIFAEFGIGNATIFSTEIENNGLEYRIPKFIKPVVVREYYLRLWIFQTVFIVSTTSGFNSYNKDRRKFKLLVGIGGTDR